MDPNIGEPKRVALWARALAWVIVLGSCVAAVGITLGFASGRLLSVPWYQLAPFVVAAVWVGPLFWIVAFTGRPPKRLFGFGSHLWRSQVAQREVR